MELFGTDGIRGVVGENKVNVKIGARIGKALVFYCRQRKLKPKIIIARDTRESGSALEEAVVSGIESGGGQAIIAGIISTPALAFLVRLEKAGAGLVISASHNPFDHNGFKPFKNDGTKFKNEEEAELEKYILDDKLPVEENIEKKERIIMQDAEEKYAEFIWKNFSADAGTSDLKIVLDCANGATFEIAPKIFKKVASATEAISASPNGKNINDNCGSQHPEKLKEVVLEKKADLGLAFDGDGDRVIAVDEEGNELTGDQMIYIIAKMLKIKGELKNNLMVTTVMSNLGFIQALEKLGIKHIAASVGDRPVFFEMQKSGAILGGEESGHIILADRHQAGDGISSGLMLIQAMSYFGKPLSELAAEVMLFPKILVNVKVKSKPELDSIPEICNVIKKTEKELGKNGRVLVRYSGTEDLCRIMIEGRDKNEISEYANKIANIINKNLS